MDLIVLYPSSCKSLQADLEDAVKRLEDLVLHATVSALKDPTDSWPVLMQCGVITVVVFTLRVNFVSRDSLRKAEARGVGPGYEMMLLPRSPDLV